MNGKAHGAEDGDDFRPTPRQVRWSLDETGAEGRQQHTEPEQPRRSSLTEQVGQQRRADDVQGGQKCGRGGFKLAKGRHLGQEAGEERKPKGEPCGPHVWIPEVLTDRRKQRQDGRGQRKPRRDKKGNNGRGPNVVQICLQGEHDFAHPDEGRSPDQGDQQQHPRRPTAHG